MDKNILEKYNYWKSSLSNEKTLLKELECLSKDEDMLLDAFFKDLSFGTAGLRGVIGVGTNRMNIFTVQKATQGIANYLKKRFKSEHLRVAISYDSRIKSYEFAKATAEVFAGNDIEVYIYKQLMPTPCCSFAVRQLKCAAGVMITASHNPSKYNGYKVYGSDGCQITEEAANAITKEIELVDPFKNIQKVDFKAGFKAEMIKFVPKNIEDEFIETVKKESVLGNAKINKNVKIIYTPLHGTGLVPVKRILKETGFNNVYIVREQKKPDGNFTTCPYPNPEIKEAMERGILAALKRKADLLIATDPDCDRVGIAVKDDDDFRLLSGNQTGVLLLNYILELRALNHTLPQEPYFVKSIVTTSMAEEVAKSYNVTTKNVLPGFKYIGDVIKSLEDEGKEKSFILGFEESYGYLSGTYVRDKDAVNGSLLIAEMFSYYKTKGISLIEKLNELYKKFGYYLDKVDSYSFEGVSGFEKMSQIMSSLREKNVIFGDQKLSSVIDYQKGVDSLPKANVVKFVFDNGSSILIRPSGTEPKIKVYYSIKVDNEENAKILYEKLKLLVLEKLK